MLPDLGFSKWFIKDNEIFWKTSKEIQRIVCQGITASILVKLPGGLTTVGICFPIPSFARIYIDTTEMYEPEVGERGLYFIGEFGDGKGFYPLPQKVSYKYGIELSPWMYGGYLRDEMKDIKSRIVNYVIENCCVGYDGILLKFRDEVDDDQRDKEWFKLFWFDGGNEYHFFNEEHTEILELVPVTKQFGRNARLFWRPKDGWKKFKRIRRFPAKTR